MENRSQGWNRHGTEIQHEIIHHQPIQEKEKRFRHQRRMQPAEQGEKQQGNQLKHYDIEHLRSCLPWFPGIMGKPFQQIKVTIG